MPFPGPSRFDPGRQDAWHEPWNGEWSVRPRDTRVAKNLRLFVPVIISLFVQVPSVFFVFHNRSLTPSTLTPVQIALELLLAVAGPLALLAARRFPGPVIAFVSLVAAIDLFVGSQEDGPPYIALAFALVSAVVRGARVWAWVAVSTAWLASLTLAGVLGVSWQPFRIASTTVGIIIVFGLAEAIRTRKDRGDEIRRVLAQRRQSEVQAERVRIARELHDVLAHSLSQINVQAGVGLHLMDNHPDKAREALTSIKSTSKSALDEVRSVLGVLRAEGGVSADAPLVPEPDLSRLPGLAASVTSQGITVTVTGAPADVPQATQLAVYRIVQESLTNVARHAKARNATVTLGESADAFTVEVTDDGVGVPAQPSPDSGGRGLLGMHERAELLGGTLDAGPLDTGGFRVLARIPKPAKETRP
ncbi:sensor histidine kinase [Glaciihabitans sp. dw_435]|uniref:sensor histidine kinase n=1 Tax=Glaciihabitans sp. dw_435 TaxID=2720081 RepID=UPI001BD42CC0|nr:sensor histidine kinase [Glaciihabitans sp. dw_435]